MGERITPPGTARAGWINGGCFWGALAAHHVRGVEPLVTLLHFELHHLAFGERLEAVHLDGREMHEHVLATLLLNEAVALGIIEPLHLSLAHARAPPAKSVALNLRVERHRNEGRREGCQAGLGRRVQDAIQLAVADHTADVAAG